MAKTLGLGDKTTMLCTFLVPLRTIVKLGSELGFMALFFMVRARVRVRVINA